MGGLRDLMDDLLPRTVLHLMVAAIIERLVMRFGGCCSLTQGKRLHLCDENGGQPLGLEHGKRICRESSLLIHSLISLIRFGHSEAPAWKLQM